MTSVNNVSFIDRMSSFFTGKSSKQPRPPSKVQRVHDHYLKANDEMVKMEADFQKGLRDDVIRPEYHFEQLESRERFRQDIAGFWFFMIKGGRQVLEYFGMLARTDLIAPIRVAGQFADPFIDGMAYIDERDKDIQHDNQTLRSSHAGHDVARFVTDEMQKMHENRLKSIIESKELEKLIQRDVGPDYEFTKKELEKCINDNRFLNPTHQRLLHGFIKSLPISNNQTIKFSDLQKDYAKHTVGLSIAAREALIVQNRLKNKMEKKFFSLKRTTEGWRFSISVAAGVTWFTLNILTWVGVGITADATTGIGAAFAATGLAISLIGLAVIAYRSPNQFLEVVKGTYILKSLHEIRKGLYKYILGYNSKLTATNDKISVLNHKLGSLKIDQKTYDGLDSNQKAFYDPFVLKGETIYVQKGKAKEFSHLHSQKEVHQARAEKFQNKLISFYESSHKYRSKITQAKIKDYQRMYRLYEKKADKTQYIDNFMDEVAVIAASDLSRKTEDRITNDITNLLVRQYCVALPDENGKVATEKELYDSIKLGLDYFMGADVDRLAKINNRLRRGKDAMHRYVISQALFGPHQERLRSELEMVGVKIEIDERKAESKTYRRWFTEEVRKKITSKLSHEESMMFYGILWNTIKESSHV